MDKNFAGKVTVTPESSSAETVLINGNTGNLVLGGNNQDGDVFLQDRQGNVRVRLSAGGQRLELLNASGEIIAMIGGAANIRAGSNGENGDLFLYRASATVTAHGAGQSAKIGWPARARTMA